MVRALLRHNEIDLNLENRWFENPLLLAVKGGHYLVVDALLADWRLTPCSLIRSLSFAKNDSIQRAVQRKIEDLDTPLTQNLTPAPKRRIGTFFKSQR